MTVSSSGVADLARQHAGTDADLLQRAFVFRLDGAEDQIAISAAVQPAVVLQFALELARRPAGVAEREDRACGSAAARNCFEDIKRGGEADALVNRQGGILDEEIGAM